MNLSACLAVAMARLGPFGPAPRMAVAVSGGADSMALTLLTKDWIQPMGGTVIALTVDHGLRPESGAEADLTLARLAAAGVAGEKLTIAGLSRGARLAERARAARYQALNEACARLGVANLLLAHHLGDQAETAMLRVLSGSGARGLAGMPAAGWIGSIRLLRPLLDVPPAHLRDWLRARGIAWIEDPSNRDPGSTRVRLRLLRDDPDGTGEGLRAIAAAMRAAGEARARQDRHIDTILDARAQIYAEGYAVLSPGSIDPEALARLIRLIRGAPYEPPLDRVAAIARSPRPAAVGGVRLLDAGRLGDGWLLVREARGLGEPVLARAGAVWDRRFRLESVAAGASAGSAPGVSRPAVPDLSAEAALNGLTGPPLVASAEPLLDASAEGKSGGSGDLTLGPLGDDAPRVRRESRMPAAVARTLPAIRRDGALLAVPHLGFGDPGWRIAFAPRREPPFVPAGPPFAPG